VAIFGLISCLTNQQILQLYWAKTQTLYDIELAFNKCARILPVNNVIVLVFVEPF